MAKRVSTYEPRQAREIARYVMRQIRSFDHVPDAGGTTRVRKWVRLKIFGTRLKGGCYRAYLWSRPTTAGINFDDPAADEITDDDFGIEGQEVIAINLPEVGTPTGTHKLRSGTPVVKFCWGIQSFLTSTTDSLPVYEIVLYDVKSGC